MMDGRPRRVPLQAVLTGAFFLVASAVILFLAAQRYVWMTGTLEREEREQDLSLARAVAAGLDHFVENSRQVTDGLAAEIVERGLLGDRPALQQLVEYAKRRGATFNALTVTDDAGEAIAFAPRFNESGRSNIGMRLDDRQWFKDAIAATPHPSFDVVIGRALGRPTIAVAAPIRSQGRVVGVVAGGVDLDRLRRSIREVDPARSDRLVVVDARGRVIAHSSPQWEAEARDLSSEAVFHAARSQGDGTIAYASLYTGTTRTAVFLRMPSTGWVVSASRGPESRREKLASLVWGLLSSSLAGAVVATIAAVLVSRVLARPLTDLAGATQRLASGRFDGSHLLPGRDSRIRESSDLLAGFRTMAERLRLQHEDLEATVAARTQALAAAAREAEGTAALLRAQEEIRRGYGELAALLNSLDRSYVLEEGTRKLAATVHAPLAAVYLTDDGPDGLRLKTYAAVDPSAVEVGLLSPAGLPQEVARRRDLVVLSGGSGAAPLRLRTGLGSLDVAAIVGLPLQYQDRFIGVLVLATVEPLSEQVRGFLTDAARQLSVALSNAALFESVRYQSQQMEELNRELKRASEVKSEFLASMSHELRTPLNSIIGFTEILLTSTRESLTERQRSALQRVRESGQHLLGLINDVLDLSKVEAGRMDVRTESFDLAALVLECLAAVEPQAQAKGLRVRRVGTDTAQEVIQDRAKVKQILINLLSNAVKFTDEGSVEVRVEPADPGFIGLSVVDTGVGIAAVNQAVVFDAFRQVGAPQDRGQSGTGLGLAISRRLAQLIGGALTVQSEPGVGSRFTLHLPARYGFGRQGAALAEVPAGSARVLVVDDDRNVVEIIREALAGESTTVEWASSAGEVLSHARNHRPAVILLDVMLQGRDDGWDTLAALKADPDTQAIPVVVHSVIDNPERARRLGADDVLLKPALAARIRATVRRFLDGDGRAARTRDKDNERT